jgi:ligand-binding sensor domain-containing protein
MIAASIECRRGPNGVAGPATFLAALVLGALLLPAPARASTRLFIVNHVASNEVRGAAPWGASLALATGGGLVLADTASGATSKILRASGGLPSNNLLSIVRSPSGLLWIGTEDRGIARMRPDGKFLRTLTSFDGLPSDRVQALYRSGDSLWVATSGGVALFTEDVSTGQVALRRSDSAASTGGALVSDDATSFAAWNDTLWCGTNAGMSAFVTGSWVARKSVTAERVQALALARDSLWIGTKTGLRVYAGGAAVSRGLAVETLALAALPWGVARGTAGGPYVELADGTESALGLGGLPLARVACLLASPVSALYAGTAAGLARYTGAATPWTPIRSAGPEANGGSRVSARNQNAWITLGNAAPAGQGIGTVLRYAQGAWSFLTNASTGGNLQSAGAIGVLATADGRVWIGHCCSGSTGPTRPRTDRWDPAADVWDLPDGHNVFAMTQAPSGRVYAAGVEYENGVYEFDGATAALLDSLTPGNTNGGLTRNNLRGIAFDGAGRAWIATVDNGVDRWNGNGTADHADDVWTHFAGLGFPSLQTTAITTVGANEAWVGTSSGAVRIVNDVVDLGTTSLVNRALGNAAVNDLAVDRDAAVWIATAVGLARVAPTGAIELFTGADGLASDDVKALAWEGGRDVLWAVTAGGVSEIHASPSSRASFGEGSYLYPNPATAANPTIRLGGISGELRGEIRDLAGTTLHAFHADPAAPAIWDLRDERGAIVAPGVYLVVLRQGDLTRVLRVAVTR